MLQIFGFLGSILGYVLWAAYYVFHNFGIAIIVFTIIIKAALFPFSVKQQKSMAGSSRLAKKQKELREKYGNNRQKLQEEMNKLYEKENVKPMGGCLTSIIPMIVILGIFYAVAYPLTNTLHLNETSVNNALAYVNSIPGYNSGTQCQTGPALLSEWRRHTPRPHRNPRRSPPGNPWPGRYAAAPPRGPYP